MSAQPSLWDYLDSIGRLDTDGCTRKARLRTCRRCHGRIIIGLDDDPAGIPTRTDTVALDPISEAVALALGRTTYDLIPGPALQYRDQFRISDRRHPVLPSHQCRSGVPLPIDDAVQRVFNPPSYQLPEECPF